MTSKNPLPQDLCTPVFLVDDAHTLGVKPARLRCVDLEHIGRGMRMVKGAVPTVLDRAGPLTQLSAHAVASHSTAAHLWGIPLPPWLDVASSGIHLIRPLGSGQPRRPGVVGHNGKLPDTDVVKFNNIWVTSPERTWVDLATMLPFPQLVAAGDALLRRADAPARGGTLPVPDPLCTLATISHSIMKRVGCPGVVLAREAFPLLRAGVDSSPESILRLSIVDAGLPEPVVNEWIVDDGGRRISRPDLQYRRNRIAMEYEGEHHLVSPEQWNRDIDRDERLRAMGWTVLRFTSKHLHLDAVPGTIAKITRALAASSGSSSHQ